MGPTKPTSMLANDPPSSTSSTFRRPSDAARSASAPRAERHGVVGRSICSDSRSCTACSSKSRYLAQHTSPKPMPPRATARPTPRRYSVVDRVPDRRGDPAADGDDEGDDGGPVGALVTGVAPAVMSGPSTSRAASVAGRLGSASRRGPRGARRSTGSARPAAAAPAATLPGPRRRDRRRRSRSPRSPPCSCSSTMYAATLSMSSLLERAEHGHRAGPDEDGLADLGRCRLHQGRRLPPAADRRAGPGRDVAGGAVELVQLAPAATSPAASRRRGCPARRRRRRRSRRGRRSAPPSSAPVLVRPACWARPSASARCAARSRRLPAPRRCNAGRAPPRPRRPSRGSWRTGPAYSSAPRPSGRPDRPAGRPGARCERERRRRRGRDRPGGRAAPLTTHCSSQIVRNTRTQITSTRCQNSETPPAHDASAPGLRRARRAGEQQGQGTEPGRDVGAVEPRQQPVHRAVGVVVGAEVQGRVLGDLVGEEERRRERSSRAANAASPHRRPAVRRPGRTATRVNDDDDAARAWPRRPAARRARRPTGGHGGLLARSRKKAAKNEANSITSDARKTMTPNCAVLRAKRDGDQRRVPCPADVTRSDTRPVYRAGRVKEARRRLSVTNRHDPDGSEDRRGCSPPQQVDGVGVEGDVEPVGGDRAAVAVVALAADRPRPSSPAPARSPGSTHEAVGPTVGQVDDDEVGRLRDAPRPRDEVLAGAVVGPAVDVGERPLATAQTVPEGGEQAVVPRSPGRRRRARPAADPASPAPGPRDPRPGPRGAGRRRGASGRRRPRRGRRGGPRTAASRGSSWFSTKRTVCAWALASAPRWSRIAAAGSTVDQPVVQPLVVAGVEALLDEHRLEVPVGLGPERELRGCAARTAPITVGQ